MYLARNAPIQEIQEVRSLYENGWEQGHIANKINRSRTYVRNLLTRNNIRLRPKGEARSLMKNHDYFASINSEEKAYWLGFISADGCIGDYDPYGIGQLKLVVTLNDKDFSHLFKLQKALNSSHTLTPVKTNLHELSIVSHQLCTDLINLGVTPRKSLTLQACRNLPSELYRHYYRGLVDGDGWLCRTTLHHYPDIGLCGSKDIVTSFNNWIVETLSITPVIVRELPEAMATFSIEYSGRKAIQIIRLLYKESSIYLDRKHNLAKEMMK